MNIYRHTTKKLIPTLMLMAAVTLIACDKAEVEQSVASPAEIRVTTTMAAMGTRTASLNLQATQLEHATEAGLYVYKSGQTSVSHNYGYENLL